MAGNLLDSISISFFWVILLLFWWLWKSRKPFLSHTTISSSKTMGSVHFCSSIADFNGSINSGYLWVIVFPFLDWILSILPDLCMHDRDLTPSHLISKTQSWLLNGLLNKVANMGLVLSGNSYLVKVGNDNEWAKTPIFGESLLV